MQYLHTIAFSIEKLKRGVVKIEICSSLNQIFNELLNLNNDDSEIIIKQIIEDTNNKFWNYYSVIYDIVKKWSKKTKIKIYCYQLMSTLVSHGTYSFQSEKSKELISLLTTSLKETKTNRKIYLELISSYIKVFYN